MIQLLGMSINCPSWSAREVYIGPRFFSIAGITAVVMRDLLRRKAMSKVLQTFDDGSELTVKDMCVSVGIGIVLTVAFVGALEFVESKPWKRFKHKHSLEQQ